MNLENGNDLIVFSSNNFGSTELRTSKLMTSFASRKKVYFVESPIIGATKDATYYIRKNDEGVLIVQPYLPNDTSIFEQKETLMNLVKELVIEEEIEHYSIWTDTPKSMKFIRNMNPEVVVYDCQKDYARTNPELEHELLQYADVVMNSAFNDKTPTKAARANLKVVEESHSVC